MEEKPLKDIARQTHSHMSSMKANLDQIEGVTDQMAMTQAAIQQVLGRHLVSEEVDEAPADMEASRFM